MYLWELRKPNTAVNILNKIYTRLFALRLNSSPHLIMMGNTLLYSSLLPGVRGLGIAAARRNLGRGSIPAGP